MFFHSLDICVNRLMRLVWGGVGGYDIVVSVIKRYLYRSTWTECVYILTLTECSRRG